MKNSRSLLNALSRRESVAAGSTTATPGKFLPPVFNRIVIDAAVSERSSSPSDATSTEESTATTTVRAPNPFVGHKNPQSGRFAPARISLRRQAELAKIYPGEYLPSGPKTRPSSKTSEQVETIQYEEDRLAVEWVGNGCSGMTPRVRRWAGEEHPSEPKEERSQSLMSGPYRGRQHQPRLFKGHKHDRQRVERREETKTRMEGMEGRIADWRKSKLDAIASAKPSLPF